MILSLGAECVASPLKLGLLCESVKSRLLEGRPREEEARIAIGEMPELKADPGHMELLLFLLLENTLACAREGVRPIIAISSEASARGLRIRVQDNGTGLASADAASGGLAVARRLVADYGGRLLMECRPGCGTLVIAELPWTYKFQIKQEEA